MVSFSFFLYFFEFNKLVYVSRGTNEIFGGEFPAAEPCIFARVTAYGERNDECPPPGEVARRRTCGKPPSQGEQASGVSV